MKISVRRRLVANIRACMLKNDVGLDSFARHLGYSSKDARNVVEGKVLIAPTELDRIASFLNTTRRKLISQELECAKFSNSDNLDRILDLIDEYVELLEEV